MMSFTTDSQFILPNKEYVKLDYFIEQFKKESQIHIYENAELYSVEDDFKTLKIVSLFNDVDNLDSVRALHFYNLPLDKNGQINKVSKIKNLLEFENEIFSLSSNNKKYTIFINKASKDQKLDIWSNDIKLKSINIENLDEHGKICLSSRLGNVSFSPSEDKILYVADEKSKTESFLKEFSKLNNSKKENNETKKEVGNEYLYKQNWGEMCDFSHLCICILSIEQKFQLKVINIPKKSLIKPFWINDKKIGFVAYVEDPNITGVYYCFNKLSNLYTYDIEKDELTEIINSSKEISINHIQINKARDKVIFFENDIYGPHFNSSKLKLWNINDNSFTTIYPKNNSTSQEYSLYVENLNKNCWMLDDIHVVFNSILGLKNVVFIINTITGLLKLIEFKDQSIQILNLVDDFLILVSSSFTTGPNVFISKLDLNTQEDDFVKVTRSNYSEKEIKFKIFNLNENDRLRKIGVTLVGLTKSFDTSQPTIVIPHGGPHGISLLSYTRLICYFVKLGFKMLLINYRGSVGYNDEYSNQLCGQIGIIEIEDTMQAINKCIDDGYVDKNNIILAGGSYGGTIVTYLIGMFPDFGFRCCVIINPVVNIATLLNSTDIPEWCINEVFGVELETFKKLSNLNKEESKYKIMNYLTSGSPELLKKMFEVSPFYYIDKVRTPVIAFLGKEDRRVPYNQGLSYIKALRIRGVETKCFIYDDNHSILKVPNNFDMVMNFTLFILKYLKL